MDSKLRTITKRISIFCKLFFLGGISILAQEEGFVIKGYIPGMEDGVTVSLLTGEDKTASLAETTVQNGCFELHGKVQHPLLCTLITNNQLVAKNSGSAIKWTYTPLFVENTEMTVEGNHYKEMTSDSVFSIRGGEAQRDYEVFRQKYGTGAEWKFIQSYPHSVVSVMFANEMLLRGYKLTTEQLDSLEKSIRSCPVDTARFSLFQKRLAIARQTTVGAPLINLEMTDTIGQKVNLTDVVSKGKFTLIDFWASWCGMCIHSMPDVKKLAEEYNDCLEVIVVSCDKDAKAWRGAMTRIDMPFPHYMLTSQGYDDFFYHKYQVKNGVPYYLLVNPEGKVMKTPSGASEVKKVLQSYTSEHPAKTRLSVLIEGMDKAPSVVCDFSMEKVEPDTLDQLPDGTFYGTYEMPKAKEVFLKVHSDTKTYSYMAYLAPEKSLRISLRMADDKFVPEYTGDTGRETEYVNLQRNIVTLSPVFSEKAWLTLPDFDACTRYVEQHQDTLKQLLKKVTDEAFARKERTVLEQGKMTHYFNYAIAKQKHGTDMEQDNSFMSFVKQLNFNDTLQHGALMQYMDWYVTAHPDLYKGEGLSPNAVKLKLLGSLSSNQAVRNKVAQNILTVQLFMQMLGVDISEVVPSVYREYLKVSTDSLTCNMARQQLKIIDNTAVGTPAIALKMLDVNGQEVSLDKITGGGKYTYIDFWATWCGPCVKEIPFIEKLVEKYKGNSVIRFVSISIDTDEAKWLKKLNADKPQWDQYRIPEAEQAACAELYGITNIPRFMMFDKDGNMLNADAPRPSEQQLIELLENLK